MIRLFLLLLAFGLLLFGAGFWYANNRAEGDSIWVTFTEWRARKARECPQDMICMPAFQVTPPANSNAL